MEQSIKVRVYFHICYPTLEFYDNNKECKSFDSINLLCIFVQYSLESVHGNLNKLPKFIRMLIMKIKDYLTLLFGFHETEILEIIIEFFKNHMWNEYIDLAKILKQFYTCNLK